MNGFNLQNPQNPPGNLRTLADMSPEEIRKLEEHYGCPVKRR